MSQEDALRLLQKYGKANDNMRLLKELLVKSSSEIAHQDQEKKQLFEKISGLEFEVRTLKTANSRERENHREELAVVSSQFADLKSEYAGMSKVAAEREVLIERLNREIAHLQAAVDGRVSKEFEQMRSKMTEFDARKKSIDSVQKMLDDKTAELAVMTSKWQSVMEENGRLQSAKAELREKTAALAAAQVDLNRSRDAIRRLEDEAQRNIRDMARLKQLAEEHRGRSDEFRSKLSDDIQSRLQSDQKVVMLERARADDFQAQYLAEVKVSTAEKRRADDLETKLRGMRLEFDDMKRRKEEAENKSRETAAQVQARLRNEGESVAKLKEQLHAEQEQLHGVRSDLQRLNDRLATMDLLRSDLAKAKENEVQLRGQLQRAEAGGMSAAKVREQVVNLTAALQEIQRRNGASPAPNLFSTTLSSGIEDNARFFTRNGGAEVGRVRSHS